MAEQARWWSGRAVAGTVVLFAVVAACIRLGFWQLDRLQQRRAVNAVIAERLEAPALADAGSVADTTGLLYRRLELTGRYDDARSIVLPGRAFEGSPGVHLLTPLVIGTDQAVLVNRGWVPSPDAATIEFDSFPAARPAGAVAMVAGVLLPLPASSPRAKTAPPDSGFRRVWYHLAPGALQAQFPYRLLPAQLQLLPSTDAPRYPKRLPPPPLDEGPHLSYAIQWFSFAAIGLIGWVALLRRGRRGPDGRAPDIGPDVSVGTGELGA